MKYDSNNIFAKIIRGEIPAQKVYEDEKVLAFHDISRAAPIHVLVIPKGEFLDFHDFVSSSSSDEIAYFFQKVGDVIKILEIKNSGFRLISNMGEDGLQTVFHFHVHILSGKSLGPLIT